MANSIRQQILDAVTSALTASTGIATVNTSQQVYWEIPEAACPQVYVVDDVEIKERMSFLHPTLEDMQSTLNLLIVGNVFDIGNDTATKSANLIRDVELAIQGSTAVNDLTQDTRMVSVQTDAGIQENFGTIHMKY